MNAQMIQLMSVIVTAVASSGAVAAIFNRRNKRERESDVVLRKAETENISTQAAATALAALRKELDAANADLDRRRAIIQGQDERIESQQKQIRRLRNQVEELKQNGRALEAWVKEAYGAMQSSGLKVAAPPSLDWLTSVGPEDESGHPVVGSM